MKSFIRNLYNSEICKQLPTTLGDFKVTKPCLLKVLNIKNLKYELMNLRIVKYACYQV